MKALLPPWRHGAAALLAAVWLSGAAWPQAGAAEVAGRSVQVSVQGLPAAGAGRLLLRALRVHDGSVAAAAWVPAGDAPATEVMLDTPATPLWLSASFVAPGVAPAHQVLGGQLAVNASDETAALTLQGLPAVAAAWAGPQSGQPALHAPAKGKTVGANPADFHLSGPGIGPYMAGGMADLLTVALVNGPCGQAGGDDAIIAVATANPKDLAALAAEARLQSSPAFDRNQHRPPQWLAPTHLGKADIRVTDGRVTVQVRIEDLQGQVIASGQRSGPAASFWVTLDDALYAMNESLCGSAQWQGTVGYEEHATLAVPNVDPRRPGATVKGDVSFTSHFDKDSVRSTVTYSNVISGAQGKASTTAAGEVQALVSFAEVAGQVVVEIGLFSINATHTASLEGGSHSSEGEIQLGGWRGEGRARPGADTQTGQWTERIPGGSRKVTWSVTRKKGRASSP